MERALFTISTRILPPEDASDGAAAAQPEIKRKKKRTVCFNPPEDIPYDLFLISSPFMGLNPFKRRAGPGLGKPRDRI